MTLDEPGKRPIAEALRDYIRRSPLRQGEIARRANMTDANMSKFLSGKQGITLDTAESLCEVLGLILVPRGVDGMLSIVWGDPESVRRNFNEAMKGMVIELGPTDESGKVGEPESQGSNDPESIKRALKKKLQEVESGPKRVRSKRKKK